MFISWILVQYLISDFSWGKIIPIQPQSSEFGKRVDRNILQFYPGSQSLQTDSQIVSEIPQTSDPQVIEALKTQNQLTFPYPQAQGFRPQTVESVKTESNQQQNGEKLETRLPDISLDVKTASLEPITSEQNLELQTPESQALQRLPLNPVQYYQLQQLNPYQDPRIFQPSNNPNYYKNPKLSQISFSPNKEIYYQAPSISPQDIRQVANPNLNLKELDIPSRTLTAPKETFWTPTNNPTLLYEKEESENQENPSQITEKPKNHATVRTVPKHYKFEKSSSDEGNTKPPSKEKHKRKGKTKNNAKESSDHIISAVVKDPKGVIVSEKVHNANDWVPIVRTVPKHYTFEKNSLETKEKPKGKKKLKGEPVERVNKPQHHIFEKGTFVKKFKKNKQPEKPLEEFEKPHKKSHKKKTFKEKDIPVHEFLDPEISTDTYQKESQILETLKTEKPKPKKTPLRDQVNSESYSNHKGVENGLQPDQFNEFHGDSNPAQSHGAAPPPAKDRTMFHMVGHDGPMSYKWGFDTGSGKNRQYRFEERDKEGLVKGQFGYLDDKGKFRKMNYNAHPVHGFSMEPADGTFDDLKQ